MVLVLQDFRFGPNLTDPSLTGRFGPSLTGLGRFCPSLTGLLRFGPSLTGLVPKCQTTQRALKPWVFSLSPPHALALVSS